MEMMKNYNALTTNPIEFDLVDEHNPDIIDTHLELIKIIKRYEYAHGWTLLIAPDKMPDRRIMDSCSVKLEKVLTIRKKYCRSAYQLAKQAIAFENCSVLVIWDSAINGVDLADIRERAHKNGIALYLLNHDNCRHEPPLIASS